MVHVSPHMDLSTRQTFSRTFWCRVGAFLLIDPINVPKRPYQRIMMRTRKFFMENSAKVHEQECNRVTYVIFVVGMSFLLYLSVLLALGRYN